MSTQYKYFAFISYSRKDHKVAAWLQKRLEWFRFPVKLVPEDRRPPNPRFVRPIYLDKTNLEVTDEHYWTNIRHALEESRFLIVLASPHSAQSEAVDMEVTHFLTEHPDSKRVVPVILEGNVMGTGLDAALCPKLRSLSRELLDRNLPMMVVDEVGSERDAWESGFVSLCSYLLQLDRSAIGDHIQRETSKQARALRRWIILVAILALVAAGSACLAIRKKAEAEANAMLAIKKQKEAEANLAAFKRERSTAHESILRLLISEGFDCAPSSTQFVNNKKLRLLIPVAKGFDYVFLIKMGPQIDFELNVHAYTETGEELKSAGSSLARWYNIRPSYNGAVEFYLNATRGSGDAEVFLLRRPIPHSQ